MDESTFEHLASDELKHLEQRLGDLPGLEVDYNGEVLSAELDDGGTIVVNSHRAARQIWLSAEMRAGHYTYDAASGRWKDDKTGEDLRVRLSGVLTRALGHDVQL